MLDTKQLSSNRILLQNGWTPKHKTNLEKNYAEITNHLLSPLPQVSLKNVFPIARNIIESLNGIIIKNPHRELGLGASSCIIEFDFFEYDSSNFSELQMISKQLGKRVLFIGIGYDLIGDWLVDEDEAIYFRNQLSHQLHFVSNDIYTFLEEDIDKIMDVNGTNILGINLP